MRTLRVILGCGAVLAFASGAFAQTGEIEHDWTLKIAGDRYGLRQVAMPPYWRATFVYFADDEILRSPLRAWQLALLSLLAATALTCGLIWVCLLKKPAGRDGA
jgi:hypothetical protein